MWNSGSPRSGIQRCTKKDAAQKDREKDIVNGPIDSGASEHMCSDQDTFYPLKRLPQFDDGDIATLEGTVLSSVMVGDIQLKDVPDLVTLQLQSGVCCKRCSKRI